jgi:hypothetical protein
VGCRCSTQPHIGSCREAAEQASCSWMEPTARPFQSRAGAAWQSAQGETDAPTLKRTTTIYPPSEQGPMRTAGRPSGAGAEERLLTLGCRRCAELQGQAGEDQEGPGSSSGPQLCLVLLSHLPGGLHPRLCHAPGGSQMLSSGHVCYLSSSGRAYAPVAACAYHSCLGASARVGRCVVDLSADAAATAH